MGHRGRGVPRLWPRNPCIDQLPPYGMPKHITWEIQDATTGLPNLYDSLTPVAGAWDVVNSWYEWSGQARWSSGFGGPWYIRAIPNITTPGIRWRWHFQDAFMLTEILTGWDTAGAPWQFDLDFNATSPNWKLIMCTIPHVIGVTYTHIAALGWHTYPNG